MKENNLKEGNGLKRCCIVWEQEQMKVGKQEERRGTEGKGKEARGTRTQPLTCLHAVQAITNHLYDLLILRFRRNLI
jgi:hypothetical protein